MSGRRVHFSEPLHQIEYLDKQWETASRLARDGSEWVRIGLDRQRFQDRIERTAEILNRILDTNFRQKIYRERFENFDITNEQQQQQQEITNKLAKTTITASENEITCIQSSIDAPRQPTIDQQQENKKTNTNNNSDNQNNRRKKRSRRRKGNNKNTNRCKHRGGHRKKY